ncbi:hypothetical protein KTH40_08670 [Acinetobacter haemolyticus]|uniref:hypothetical protein n=1 Tax=Acinetobacter haemolyticus TaxID=29430 RepID=UPI0021CF4999|nr:hypothetical protein [Acinetobacter haemolyticus]MCU4387678.1 hypothetical protein [Acinetobacter haemolyticus]
MIVYTLLSAIASIYLCFLILNCLKKYREKDQAPRVIREWILDDPEGELYVVYITSDQKVWSACGRYAMSSGSTSTTWSNFLAGDLNDLVRRTMGQKVLEAMRECLKQQNIK